MGSSGNAVGILGWFLNLYEQVQGVVLIILGMGFAAGIIGFFYFVSLWNQRNAPGGEQQVSMGRLVSTAIISGILLSGTTGVFIAAETLNNQSSSTINSGKAQEELKKQL